MIYEVIGILDFKSISLAGQIIYRFSCPEKFSDLLLNYSEKNVNWNKVEPRNKLENSGRSYIPDPEKSLSLISDLATVHSWIESCFNIVKDEVGWNRQGFINKLKVTQSWLNCSLPGEVHHSHNHALSLLSSVLYLQGTGETVFYLKSMYSMPQVLDSGIGLAKMYYPIKVISPRNSLIVFPSTLNHSVEANQENTNRISLSANSWFDGEIGNPKNAVYIQ